MAKIVITVEDKADGNVKVECNPTFETMMMMAESGHPLTAGHGYALAALNRIRQVGGRGSAGRDQSSDIKIQIPKKSSIIL